MFGPRFIQHAETVRHGVDEARTRNPVGLVRRRGVLTDPPKQVVVYRGVRFRTDEDDGAPDSPETGDGPDSSQRSDQGEREGVQTVQTPSETLSTRGSIGNLPEGMHSLHTPGSEPPVAAAVVPPVEAVNDPPPRLFDPETDTETLVRKDDDGIYIEVEEPTCWSVPTCWERSMCTERPMCSKWAV